ncbi:hypothetical protein ACFLUA_04590 [Chloroflexota bacterium]
MGVIVGTGVVPYCGVRVYGKGEVGVNVSTFPFVVGVVTIIVVSGAGYAGFRGPESIVVWITVASSLIGVGYSLTPDSTPTVCVVYRLSVELGIGFESPGDTGDRVPLPGLGAVSIDPLYSILLVNVACRVTDGFIIRPTG